MLVPLSVLLAVYYALDGDLSSLGGKSLRLTLETPSTIALEGRVTALPLGVALANRSGSSIQLTAADPCKVLRWVVQAPGDAFVQSKGDACQPEEPVRPIASGETITLSETLPLVSTRYKPGVRYTLIVQYYGETATTDFSVTAAD